MDVQENNYVIGRGRLFFGQFRKGTRKPMGQLYFGNTPELSTSQDEDTIDHYSSEGGVKVKDASATLQNDASASFACDNISMANLALWFRGELIRRIEAGSATATQTVTLSTTGPEAGDTLSIGGQAITFVDDNPAGLQVVIGDTLAATATAIVNFLNATPALGVTASAVGSVVTLKAIDPGTAGNGLALAKAGANIAVGGATLVGGTDVTETISGIRRGFWYQLGQSADTPQGVRHVGSVKLAGVSEDSIIVEEDTGRFYVNLDADDVVDDSTIEVTYGIQARVEEIVIAKGETIEGELQFLANNAAGANRDYFWPYVKLTPDGDLPLKGDDWQAMTFNVEILKRDAVTERQYITAR